ncbi:MAG: hypothetical protein M1830_000677 [Pleopsidium flavum]|nr:MAG: hypothetical protein M1830_000677 [Pleopsidium flavum]
MTRPPMRPSAGGNALAERSRKSSSDDATTPLAGPGHGTPTTFFLANEDMMEKSTSEMGKEGEDSAYGVESLEETICGAEDGDDQEKDKKVDEEDTGAKRQSPTKLCCKRQGAESGSQREQESTPSNTTSTSRSRSRRTSPTTISQPLTPPSLISSAPGSSLPSSPKSTSTRSFRHSDEDSMADDAGSQAIGSSGEEDADSPTEIQDSAPQLIMPSIKMPSRRPFTEKGKNMGRLKVLIAGDSGVGKTSLIKSIVQICEDIVHVDPLSPSSPTLSSPQTRKPIGKTPIIDSTPIKQITEVYASTKPYPSWWSEFEESKVLRRRKSMGDTVLERNLCFVDTPGYGGGMSLMEGVEQVIQYVEAQIARTTSTAQMNDADLVSLMSGNGGSQVDVVLYMISEKLEPIDLEFLKRLSALTNVIPLIAKADLHLGNITGLMGSIGEHLQSAGIRSFPLPKSSNGTWSSTDSYPPYAVSSAPSNDTENMDASLLMSPDYVRPLIPTELAALVEQVFERDTIGWLRHSAAMKCLHWRNGAASSALSVPSPRSTFGGMTPLYTRMGASISSSSLSSPSTSQVLVSYNGGGASSYTLARVSDHTQREEKLAQVRLAKWAGELQRSLQNERERYEALAKGERAIWLTERLGECVVDGTLVPVDQNFTVARQHNAGMLYKPASRRDAGLHVAAVNPRDPLGLLQWNETMKRRGWVAVQVVGSFSVIGALAMWFAKSWGFGGESLFDWNWTSWGGGE